MCTLYYKNSILSFRAGIFGVTIIWHNVQVPVRRGYARAYDYSTVEMRTHENHQKDAQNALDSGTVRCSVYLYVLCMYNYNKCTMCYRWFLDIPHFTYFPPLTL